MGSYSAFAQFYDAFMDDVDYAGIARRCDRIITERVPGRGLLLDLACGTGSLSCELAKLGYDVIGVDASADMLSVASQKAEGLGVSFVCQRMEKLDLYGTVSACVCSLDSLNHLGSDGALLQTFKRVSLFLEPNGVFVFDINTPYKHEKILGCNSFVYERDGVLLAWRNFTEGLVTEVSLDFFCRQSDGRYIRRSDSFFERAFLPNVVNTAIKKAGLTLVGCYGEDGVSPPAAGDERNIYVCGKD